MSSDNQRILKSQEWFHQRQFKKQRTDISLSWSIIPKSVHSQCTGFSSFAEKYNRPEFPSRFSDMPSEMQVASDSSSCWRLLTPTWARSWGLGDGSKKWGGLKPGVLVELHTKGIFSYPVANRDCFLHEPRSAAKWQPKNERRAGKLHGSHEQMAAWNFGKSHLHRSQVNH